MAKSKKVKSPCNGNCKISKKKHFCKGCKRTRNEITGWGKLSAKERKKILQVIEIR